MRLRKRSARRNGGAAGFGGTASVALASARSAGGLQQMVAGCVPTRGLHGTPRRSAWAGSGHERGPRERWIAFHVPKQSLRPEGVAGSGRVRPRSEAPGTWSAVQGCRMQFHVPKRTLPRSSKAYPHDPPAHRRDRSGMQDAIPRSGVSADPRISGLSRVLLSGLPDPRVVWASRCGNPPAVEAEARRDQAIPPHAPEPSRRLRASALLGTPGLDLRSSGLAQDQAGRAPPLSSSGTRRCACGCPRWSWSW